MRLRLAVLATGMLLALTSAQAATLLVGPDGGFLRLSEALQRAQSGDVIELLPGTYRGEVGVVEQKQLTIRGVGGARPVLLAEGKVAEGKAMLVVRDGDVRIDNLEFRGARAPDANGAAIRFEKGSLRVTRCRFADNQNGILTANFGDARLAVEDSEFSNAPRDGGLNHLLYVGRIAQLSVRGSRFHSGHVGHLVKSRAAENRLEYNLIYDGPGGAASYEVDLPNGGVAYLIGNVIGQSATTENPVVVAFGAEAERDRPSRLYMAHNTFINDKLPGAWFLRVWTDRLAEGVHVQGLNNLIIGPGMFEWSAPGEFAGTTYGLSASLRDIGALDFELQPDSWLRLGSVAPLPGQGPDGLMPRAQFVLPVGTRPLTAGAPLQPGAMQSR
jgi:hypothetical protein